MKRLTMKAVNKELAKIGKIQLCKGNGYFWFYGEDVYNCCPSVHGVFFLNELSLDRWIEEAKEVFLKAE